MDFEQNTLVLFARTEDECDAWVASLRYAAHRKLENHYELGPLIGEGGFAKVRLGRCALTRELRAIKTMQKSKVHAKLFGNEIAIIKRVSHPNIVKTFDVYETNSEIHIVMEYMEGGMLYDAIEDGVRFNEEDVAQFMRELLDGILYLHRLGIVHRDMKPENVLCTSKEVPLHVKIADFGLSSMTTLGEQKANKMLMSTMIGTPEFVAPEMVIGGEYSEKVDIWALGMLCYNVVCGNLPLDEEREPFPQIRNGIHLTFPEKEWETYSKESKSFLRALLCANPEKRLTPLACLVHPWLDGRELGVSNRIAQYGRVSKYLVEKAPEMASRKSKRTACPDARRHERNLSSAFQCSTEVRKMWVIAFLSVAAANRFDWLIHPDRYARAQKKYENRCMEYISTSTRESEASQNSSAQDIKSMREVSDTEDEGSSMRYYSGINKDRGCSRDFACPDRKESSTVRRGAFVSTTANISARGCPSPRKAASLNEETGYPRKPKTSLKNKLFAAISSNTGNRLAPVRKLSRRLAKKVEGKKGNDSSTFGAGKVDLDLGLDCIDIVDVDESDVLSLENAENDEIVGPASLMGKKHRFLLKMQKDIGQAEGSPTTPQKEFS